MKPIVSVNTNQAWAREVKDYLMIALGMILYGIGWTVFLLPNNLPSGAVRVSPLLCIGEQGFPFNTPISLSTHVCCFSR